MTKDQIIEKQDEIIQKLKDFIGLFLNSERKYNYRGNLSAIKQLEQELSSLKEAEKEVTDADIEKWAKSELTPYNVTSPLPLGEIIKEYVRDAMIIGAKAMRDGKIKPTETI